MNDPNTIFLGVNIDHVATLRQARGTTYPRPAEAAYIAERAGADSITVHLREDRRHIQDRDLDQIKDILRTRMNLECAITAEMRRELRPLLRTNNTLIDRSGDRAKFERGCIPGWQVAPTCRVPTA